MAAAGLFITTTPADAPGFSAILPGAGQVTVCHYQPGTSKWNKIEQRMFSFISLHWRGQPLVNYATVLHRIGSTRTKTGLRIEARLDRKVYAAGEKISETEMQSLNLRPHRAQPHWNYTIAPRTRPQGTRKR